MLDDLCVEVQKGNALFVLGAGTSILASENAQTASWKGLLRDGMQRIVELERCKPPTAARLGAQIESDDVEELLSVATFIGRKLGQPTDGEFRRWLRESVGNLPLKDASVLEALHNTGCVLLTTNYDELIEKATRLSPITWQEIDRCELVLRGVEKGVIHIHGFWSAPETVVFGQDTYALVTNSERVQTFIRAAHLEKTFVYVGFGDGLSDPNFANFFAWSEALFPDSQSRRYRLVRDQDVSRLQQMHPAKQRVQVVSYGGQYSDLTRFILSLSAHERSVPKLNSSDPIRTLLPNRPPDPRFELRDMDWYEESDAMYLHGRTGDIDRIKQLLVANPIVRLAAPSGTGKSSLLRAGIIPALRRLGWRAIVVRPYNDPGSILPGEISRELLNPSSRPLTGRLDYHTLRQELSSLLAADGTACLALLIDQAEDIFAPTASTDARARFRDFLREIYRCRDVSPLLRAVISYRTEAEAQLGRIWQEASGDPSGFPYHTLLGITPEDAEAVLTQVAERLDWKLEIPAHDLAVQLRAQSRGSMHDGSVFPPYLQILLSTIAATSAKIITSDAIHELGEVEGILTTYLRRVVDRLEQRGGDYQYVRTVLQAVCRSSGEKLRQTLPEIATYAGLAETRVRGLLDELVRQRLVRPLDGDSYEIRHDQLANVIIAELDPFEKEFKQASELLRSKAASFATTRALLTESETEMLFRHRGKLPSRDDTDELLIASVFDLFQSSGQPPVGWHWFKETPLREVINRLERADYPLRTAARKALATALSNSVGLDIDYLTRLATNNVLKLRDGAISAIARCGGPVDKLHHLLTEEHEGIRHAAVVALRRIEDRKSRGKIRSLAKNDVNPAVRRAALETLMCFPTKSDIVTLRHIVVTRRGEIPRLAVEKLAGLATPLAVDALKYLLQHAQAGGNRALVARALLRNPTEASAATDRILAANDWYVGRVLAQESTCLSVLKTLSWDRARSVRTAALKSIGSLGTKEAYETLVDAYGKGLSPLKALLEGIALTGREEAFVILKGFAEDLNTTIRSAAVSALRLHGSVSAVTYLIDRMSAWEPPPQEDDKKVQPNPFEAYVADSIEAVTDRSLLPWLKKWAQASARDIRIAAIGAYARLSDLSERTWMFELLKIRDDATREAAINSLEGVVLEDAGPILRTAEKSDTPNYYSTRAIQRFLIAQNDPRAIPALRDICHNGPPSLRYFAIESVAKFSDAVDLSFLIAVARNPEDGDRAAAIEGLAQFANQSASETLREIALADDEMRLVAADAFCAITSGKECVSLLEECVRQGRFEVAGTIDKYLNAPSWWPTV